MLSKTQLLNYRWPTSEQVVSRKTNAEDPDRSIISDTLREVLGFRKALVAAVHLNGELSSFFHRRLQGIEVRQGRGQPHTKPLISSAVRRSTERLNLHSLCGQSA